MKKYFAYLIIDIFIISVLYHFYRFDSISFLLGGLSFAIYDSLIEN